MCKTFAAKDKHAVRDADFRLRHLTGNWSQTARAQIDLRLGVDGLSAAAMLCGEAE